jgi:serine/threonine protein kinase
VDAEAAVGSEFGEFKLAELIGGGHSSRVYRADHPSFGRDVALKIVDASDAALLEVAVLTGKVSHPRVVTIYGHGEVDGQAWLAMRLITGAELSAWLTHSPLTHSDVNSILRQVASGLDALHEAGLAHGDVKPQNILITTGAGQPDRFHTHLIDPVPPDSQLMTLDYAAPERLEGASATAACDQYSLATVAYELIAGTIPFPGATPSETSDAHLHSDAPPSLWESGLIKDPTSATALDTVFRTALARDPAHRYASCSGLAAAVQSAMTVTLRADRATTNAEDRSTGPRRITTEPGPTYKPARWAAGEAEELLAYGSGAVGDDDVIPQWRAREERPDWAKASIASVVSRDDELESDEP